MSKPLTVRVENGRLVGEAPPGLPEGTELIVVLDDGGDDMDDDEIDALSAVLAASIKQAQAGRGVSAEELLERLRHKYK